MPDAATTNRFERLLCEYLDGDLSEDAAVEFVDLLEAEPEYTQMLSEQLAMDARLTQFENEAGGSERFLERLTATLGAELDGSDFVDRVLEWAEAEETPETILPSSVSRRFWLRVAAAAAVLAIGALVWHLSFGGRPEVVARFAELDSCRWMDPCAKVTNGDAIVLGERIGIAAGRAELKFESGARLTVFGPAIVEARSRNGGCLILGKADLVAETAESKGFVLETQTSRFVDIGTSFSAGVAADGLSRLEVTEGIVDVLLDDPDQAHRLQAGETIFVEPGEKRILTRIEAGDGTAAFRFPTIQPPASDDYADRSQGHATIRVARGRLVRVSGGVPASADVLLDGKGQSQQDSPGESAFFHPKFEGGFLLDLGRAVAVQNIHTYSWHQHEEIAEHRERAQQSYTLYGFAGDDPPDLTQPLEESGWTRIARVNTDESLHVESRIDRPAQQACAITAEEGAIGSFRYLLWDLKGGTFYGEIDVFTESGPADSDPAQPKPSNDN